MQHAVDKGIEPLISHDNADVIPLHQSTMFNTLLGFEPGIQYSKYCVLPITPQGNSASRGNRTLAATLEVSHSTIKS